jgi:hypothetical protein
MIFSPDDRVLVKEDLRGLYVDKSGVVRIRVVPGLPANLRDPHERLGDRALTTGLGLHPDMVKFLARDDVHEALKKAVHAEEHGWPQELPFGG